MKFRFWFIRLLIADWWDLAFRNGRQHCRLGDHKYGKDTAKVRIDARSTANVRTCVRCGHDDVLSYSFRGQPVKKAKA